MTKLNKTVAVYGASSNIGSKFIEKAVTKGVTIIAFARNTSKISFTSKKINVIKGDITNLNDVRKALNGKKIDATINFAANFSHDLATARAVNVTGERYILQASKEFGIKRHIFISTIATQMKKPNAYRDTKLAAEKEVKKAGKHGLNWIILRYANVLGTNAWDNPFKLIIPGLRLAVPKVPTSAKNANFPYVTIETAVESALESLIARPNQTITVLDGKITLGKYLSSMEKVYNVKKSFLPLKPLQFLNVIVGKYIPQISDIVSVSEFMSDPPAFENKTMKRELRIKTRGFQTWMKIRFKKTSLKLL